MRRIDYRSAMVLAATMAGASLASGCVVEHYDRDHHDSHHWDSRQDHAYHRYLDERHREYRDYSQLSAEEQSDYWNWRHAHADD